MRAVVTGATSMLGVALINELIKANNYVLAIVRKSTSRISRLPSSKLIKIVELDLQELQNFSLEDSSYDVFYHFAWIGTSREERDNPIIQEKNILYSLQAVELAYRLGCAKFVGAGSQAEYGYVSGIINEDTPTNPRIAYGMAKLASYHLCERRCEQLNMRIIWGRIFSVYGCNDNRNTMIDYAINQFMNNEYAHFSSAKQMWNYLYEEDAGRIFYALGKENVSEKVYCIANTESKPLKDYIECIVSMFATSRYDYANTGVEVEPGIQPDVTKLVKEINFIPSVSFSEGIKHIINSTRHIRNDL